MWLPDVADASEMTQAFSRHADALGLVGVVGTWRLLDARMSHPDRPSSPLCSGWATYELRTADTTEGAVILLYIKAFQQGASSAAWQKLTDAQPGNAARHLPALDLIVWRFPEDPGLPALPVLVDPMLAAGHLPSILREELAGPSIGPGGLGVTMVRYQPETSAMLRYDVDPGGASKASCVFAKNLARTDLAATARRHHELWSLIERFPGLRIAEPLAADLQLGVLWTRAVVGQPMVSGLQPDRLRAVSEDVALVLASLHDSGVAVQREVWVDDAMIEMRKKCNKLTRAHPPIASEVATLVASTELRRSRAGKETHQTLHGDFHLDQLIDGPDGAFLVDLDSMVGGSPEMDLAEFVVDLCLRKVPQAVVREMVPLVLDSYEGHAGHSLDKDLLRVFADAEFVNRCYRHLRRQVPGWSTELEQELTRHDFLASVLST